MTEKHNKSLRAGWRMVKFGDVVRQCKEKADPETSGLERFVAGDHMDTDSLRLRRWGEIGSGYLGPAFNIRFRPGQVLYGSRRTYLRKVALADFEGICANTTFVLETKNHAELLPELLPFVMHTENFTSYSVKNSKGSVNPYINFSDLADFAFPLPPLAVQKEYVALLQGLEGLRIETSDAFTAAWTLRLSAYQNLTFHDWLDEAPAHWERSTIGKSLRISNSLRKPISADIRARMRGDFPYYGPTGRLDSIDEYRLDGEFVLIGEDGDHFLKYKTWSMTQLIVGKANVNNHAHVIQGSESCLTEWFFHFYRHRDVREFLTKQGAGRLKLKKGDLERMPILVPPLAEQREIVGRIQECVDGTEALRLRQGTVTELLRAAREEVVRGAADVQ